MPTGTLLDALRGMPCKATIRTDDGGSASVAVDLPFARALLTHGRRERLVWQRRDEPGGPWAEVAFHELPPAAQGEVRAYVASCGLSADPRVEGVSVHADRAPEVRWRAGCGPSSLADDLRLYVLAKVHRGPPRAAGPGMTAPGRGA